MEEDLNPLDFSDAESDVQSISSSSTLIFNINSDTESQLNCDDDCDFEYASNSSPCCSNACFKKLSLHEMDVAKTKFLDKSQAGQNQYLLDCAIMSLNSTFHAAINGKLICKKALCHILGVSRNRYGRICRQAKAGAISATSRTISPSHQSVRGRSIKYSETVAWMERFFDSIGDKMPHLDRTHLPHFMTKRDIYHKMRVEFEDRNIREVVSLAHFYKIWDKEFKKVVIPAVSSCSACS